MSSDFPSPITRDYYDSHINKLNAAMSKELFRAYHSQFGRGVKANGVTRFPDGAWMETDGQFWQLNNNWIGSDLDKARNVFLYFKLAEEVAIAEFREYKKQIIEICRHGVDPRRPVIPGDTNEYKRKLEALRKTAREMKAAKQLAQDNVNKVDPTYISPEERQRRDAELARLQLVVDSFRKEVEEIEV